MRWILENFQLVVIIVGAFIFWLKSLIERKLAEKKVSERREQEEEIPDSDASRPWEEYDVAPTGMPPPLPPPRQHGYEEAVAREAAAAEAHRQKLAGRLRRIQETKADTTGDAAATRAKVSAKDVKTAAAAAPTRLRGRLRHPAEVRRAIVMREILGPPVGLR
jgi:hypothetical protein